MDMHARRGFTLIELLVVIAIISILAGLLSIGLPRALEKAKISKMQSTFGSIHNIMGSYLAEHGTYPPGYGYLQWLDRRATLDEDRFGFVTEPWTAYVGMHEEPGMNDVFAESYDSNRDGLLGFFEYLPIFEYVDSKPTYPTTEYRGLAAGFDASLIGQRDAQLNADTRPVIYIPVNLNDFAKVQHYTQQKLVNGAPATGDVLADRQMMLEWDIARHAGIESLTPTTAEDPQIPPKYDAYVLIGVGPAQNTFGVLKEPDFTLTQNAGYLAGLQTFFLATRDVNRNGAYDMDFQARSGPDRGYDAFKDTGFGPADRLALMPDGSGGAGPMISVRK